MIQLSDSSFDTAAFAAKTTSFPGTRQDQEPDSLMSRILKHNDYPAFEQLFKLLYNSLCNYCVKYVYSREVAEEVVSDVFYNIWKNRARLEVTAARSYLFASVRNRSVDHLRKNRRTISCTLEEAMHIAGTYADSQDQMVQEELNRQMDRSIASLPTQCRRIFELSRHSNMKYKEIAETLNISIKTVETQIGRALKHLRQSISAF